MARTEKILTQREIPLYLSGAAMGTVIKRLEWVDAEDAIQCEIDNFRNALLNLIERGVDMRPDPVIQSAATDNSDLI